MFYVNEFYLNYWPHRGEGEGGSRTCKYWLVGLSKVFGNVASNKLMKGEGGAGVGEGEGSVQRGSHRLQG